MPEIVVGTTTAPFKAASQEVTQWLEAAHKMALLAFDYGFEKVHFFAAIEVDARGMGVYGDLTNRLKELHDSHERIEGGFWTFALDDKETSITATNRLHRICMGRNLVQEYALQRRAVSHILFLDSDLRVPTESIVHLAEMDYPIVGGDVPAYCLGGPTIDDYRFPVQQHWNTAGFLMVKREVFRRVAWRSSIHEEGLSDDPCYARDVEEAGFGPTRVRKDVIGVHKPLVGLLRRGHDLEIHR